MINGTTDTLFDFAAVACRAAVKRLEPATRINFEKWKEALSEVKGGGKNERADIEASPVIRRFRRHAQGTSRRACVRAGQWCRTASKTSFVIKTGLLIHLFGKQTAFYFYILSLYGESYYNYTWRYIVRVKCPICWTIWMDEILVKLLNYSYSHGWWRNKSCW